MKKTLFALATLSVFAGGQVAYASTAQKEVQTNHGWVNFHTQARLNSQTAGKLQLGEAATLISKVNAWWYEVDFDGKTLYITTNANYTHVTGQPTSKPPVVSTPAPTPVATPVPVKASWQVQADKVVAAAKSQLGVKYWWGHQVAGVGFDCSNFVAWSYSDGVGIHFSGSSVYQRNNVGTPINLNSIREGDLLFFKTANNSTGGGHVGIYMGNGYVVQEGGGWGQATVEPLAGTWLGHNLVFARRVLN